MKNEKFAKIVLRRTFFGKSFFTFAIPAQFLAKIKVGQVVKIPFRKETFRGIVWEISSTPPAFETREILEIISPEPLLQKWQIKFAQKIAAQNFASLARTAAFFLPSKIFDSKTIAPQEIFLETLNKNFEPRGARQKKILEFLRNCNSAEIGKVRAKTDSSAATIKNLIEKKVLRTVKKNKFSPSKIVQNF